MAIKMNQEVSLGKVIFKSSRPIFERIPASNPNGQPVYNADGTQRMINSKTIIGTSYSLSCGGLEPRFQDIVVKIDGDLTGENASFEAFEPVVLEGLEMNPWGQTQGNFTNINLSWTAKAIVSQNKGKMDKKQAS